MHDYADYLRKKREAAVAVVAKFEQRYAKSPQTIFCFYEGGLDIVAYQYSVRRAFANTDTFSIVCDGKKGVLQAFERISQSYGELANTLYFVDRDYDDHCGTQAAQHVRLFITEGYSFENHFTTRAAFKILLEEVLCIQWSTEEISEKADHYEEFSSKYYKHLLPLLGIALHFRATGGKINFSNVKIQDLFTFDVNAHPTRRKKSLGDFLASCQAESKMDLSIWAARKYIKLLKSLPFTQSIRGKFSLWYFCYFLRAFLLQQKGRKKKAEKQIFINFDPSDNAVVQVASGRVEIPGLKEFLSASAAAQNLL